MKITKKMLMTSMLGSGIILVGANTDAFAKEGEVEVQILGINDLHGQMEGTGSVYEYGKKLKEKGGSAPLLAGYLDKEESKFKEEKKEDAATIRVQAGDMVGASQAVSGILQDEPVMKSLKEMNFKVGTIGNHEFDEGLEEFNRVLVGGTPEKGKFNKAVDAYPHENTNMEITIANVKQKSDDKVPFGWQPYIIKEIKDSENEVAKIGFIGVVTEEIPTLVLKKQWEDYNVTDPAEAISKYAKELKTKGVNAIVVLAHASATSPKDNADEVGGEVKKIIDKLTELDPTHSVDIILAGHNHVITNGTYKGIRVVEAASHGKAFDNVKATYNIEKNDFTNITASVIPVLEGKDVKPNEKVKALADDAKERIKDIVNEKIATAESTISRTGEAKSPANLESPLGNLITDGQLKAAKDAGYKADFAITNNGGIRGDLEVVDGVVTWGAAQKVQPFGNVMQIIEISGKDLIATLNSQYNSEETYFLQMSGIGYSYKEAPEGTVDAKGNPIKWVVDKAWIEKDGKRVLIENDKKYVGVINDFLYGGGDDFPELKGPEHSKLLGALDPDTEIFVNYLKGLKDVKAPKLERKVYYKDLKEEIMKEEQKEDPKKEQEPKGKSETEGTKRKDNHLENNDQEQADKSSQKEEDQVKKAENKKVLPNTGSQTASYVGLAAMLMVAAYGLRRKVRK